MEISSPQLLVMLSVLDAETNSFAELARIAGLQPNCDFCGADLRNVNFGSDDLSEFEFRNTDLTGSRFIARIWPASIYVYRSNN
jgi:uncharacterized protein YjbI with pentapeptide repeats